MTPEQLRAAAGCLIVPAVLALLLYAVWPSRAERQHWHEITADLRSEP